MNEYHKDGTTRRGLLKFGAAASAAAMLTSQGALAGSQGAELSSGLAPEMACRAKDQGAAIWHPDGKRYGLRQSAAR